MMERTSASHSRAFAAAKARRTATLRRGLWALTLLGAVPPATLGAAEIAASSPTDRIYLVSTRGIGTRCECAEMAGGLRCEEFVNDAAGAAHWNSLTWNNLVAQLSEPMPTVIYVHGNRVEAGDDRGHGLWFHREIATRKPGDLPIRFIIWSWPSSKIPGIVRDYQVKAARTKQVSWQLAWAVDQMPSQAPLSLIGYSYGARVVTGSLHLLAGGRLGELVLTNRVHPIRPPVNAALLAAAVDAGWIRRGGYHGRALEQVDQLLLVNNHLDPAMRFYHLAFPGDPRPLGYGGMGRSSLGEFADRVRSVDVTSMVGRRHGIDDYFASSDRMAQALEQVVILPALKESDTSLAGRASARQ